MGPPAGISMWPMLRNRHDVMMVVPTISELRRYDVALYRRGENTCCTALWGITNMVPKKAT